MTVDESVIDDLKPITEVVIGAAIEVHRRVGPGLLESAYQECLSHEFQLRDITFQREKQIPLNYKGLEIPNVYRLDFLIENKVILEIKAIDAFESIHQAQVMTYLQATNCPLGLLINFNKFRLTDGIKRIIHLPKKTNQI